MSQILRSELIKSSGKTDNKTKEQSLQSSTLHGENTTVLEVYYVHFLLQRPVACPVPVIPTEVTRLFSVLLLSLEYHLTPDLYSRALPQRPSPTACLKQSQQLFTHEHTHNSYSISLQYLCLISCLSLRIETLSSLLLFSTWNSECLAHSRQSSIC